jgi:hypothetical protein
VFWRNLSQRLFLAQPFPKAVFGATFPKGCFCDTFSKSIIYMKTKKYRKITHRKITHRKITHRKHYRKKNVIKSKKLCKSNNKKKQYKGGEFSFADFDMSLYTFNSLHNMLVSLENLIEPKNDKKHLYEGSILSVIVKPISNEGTINDDIFNNFPELIKLILKLEVKPSNTLDFIYYMLGIEEDIDKEGLKALLHLHPQLIEFIDKNRNETETEIDYEVGWSLLSSFVETLIEVMDVSADFGLDLKEKIQTVYNADSIIQCGLMDTFLDDIQLVNKRDNKSKLTIFYDSFRRETVHREPTRREPIKTIYDFFNKAKNPTGILPPFVLFILSCRINPRINKDIEVMNKHRMSILNQVQYYLTICCKQCCVGEACTESKCVTKESKIVSLTTIPNQVCPHNCIQDFNWKTFDSIFKLATNNGPVIQHLIKNQLFYNIVPLSTFLPINANSYIQDVFFKNIDKKKRDEFNNKIEFYENEIYKAYKQAPDGVCGDINNDDLCSQYVKDGPLYIPYELLLIIIKKFEKKDKPLTVIKYSEARRSKRDTIREKAASASASASINPEKKKSSLSSRFYTLFKSNPKTPQLEKINEESAYVPPSSQRSSSHSQRFYSLENNF